MAKVRLRVIRAVPGATCLQPIVANFVRGGEGIITAFSDSVLPLLNSWIPDDADVDVRSFGEVVSHILQMAGEPFTRLAPGAHQRSAMAAAVRGLEDSSPFALSAGFPGCQQALLDSLKELAAWGIDASEMGSLADQCAPRLASKLRSLAQLDTECRALLEQLNCSRHSDHLAACIGATLEEEAKEVRLLVFVGSEIHPLRLRWLRWAAENGMEITVVVERHATDGRLFRGAKVCESLLGVAGQDFGDGHRLLRRLFAESEHDGAPIAVSIQPEFDRLAEVEWTLRRASQTSEEETFGIFVRDLDGYAPLLQTASERLGVPVEVHRRVALMSNAFVRMTLAVLEFCASNDVRLLRATMRSSYLRLSTAEQKQIESALYDSYGFRDLQWTKLAEWAELNAETFGWLKAVLEWRSEVHAETRSLNDWLGALRDLVHELPWQDALQSAGYAVKRDTYAFTVMQGVLASEASIEQLNEVSSFSLAEFVSRCRGAWELADVGVPSTEARIQVSNDAMSLAGADHVAVLGMLEGVFPRRRSEDPILTDEERGQISDLRPGEPRLLTSHDVAAGDRDEFYRLCGAAQLSLTLSYPESDGDRDSVEAFYLEVVKAAAGLPAQTPPPSPEFAPEATECTLLADQEIRQALSGPIEGFATVELVTPAAREAVTWRVETPISPFDLKDALQCPFKAMAKGKFDLYPGEEPRHWSKMRKLPQRALLAARQNEAEASLALGNALRLELDELYPLVPEWELQLLKAGGERLIDGFVRREFAARDCFGPISGTQWNVPYGAPGVLKGTVAKSVQLKGDIPAVSIRGDARVGHLYGRSVAETKKLEDPDGLFFGTILVALSQGGVPPMIELETGTKRVLIIRNRSDFPDLTKLPNEGIDITELDNAEGSEVKSYGLRWMELVEKARKPLLEGTIEPTPGKACEHCGYGELCRRSRDFSEGDLFTGPVVDQGEDNA